MSPTNADIELIAWVQQQINSGSRRIVVSSYLLTNAGEATIEEVRRLCKLNGVSVEVRV